MLITLVGDKEGSCIVANCPYTPENAAKARAHYGDKLNNIVNELLVGL
jgi:hypothetical protein